MAFDSLDKFLQASLTAQRLRMAKISVTTEGAGTYHSMQKVGGFPGAASSNPTTGTGRIPTSATAGALPLVNASGSNKLRLARFEASLQTAGVIWLYDRLWDNSGLVGNVATSQTVNSLALTRPDANGAGVELWGEVYTPMGATGTTFTATYTNQAGTGSKSATYVMPSNALTAGQMFPFSLAAGDTGVRSVQSIQLGISTGTAGDFGLVLLRRIIGIPITGFQGEVLDFTRTALAEIYPSACLMAMLLCSTTTSGLIELQADMIETET